MGREDELQQFLRVIEPRLHLRSVRAQRLRGHLHRGLHAGHCRILAHEPHFIHADSGIAFEGCAQLLGQRARRGWRAAGPGGKRADEPRQAGLRALRREHDAGDSRAGNQPRKTLFRRRGFQRYAVQVELVAVRSQQQASSTLSVQHGTQFVPRNFKLRRGARVAELIQPRELQQNIQAADKGPRCGGFSVRGHAPLAILSEILPVRLR